MPCMCWEQRRSLWSEQRGREQTLRSDREGWGRSIRKSREEREKVKTKQGRLGAHAAEVQDALVTFRKCIGVKNWNNRNCSIGV